MKELYGVVTAMTTSFDKIGNVDYKAVEDLTEFLIRKKVNCLYPCGTTGEMYLMSMDERKKIAKTVVDKAQGRVTVFIHVGAMTTKDTIELAQHAHSIGADGIGVVTPSYFGVSEEGIIDYFVEIARSIPKNFPMYLYGIPQCSVNDISFHVANECAKLCENVVGIKYSYPDMHKIIDFLQIRNGKFSVVVGSDRLFLPSLVLGCSGAVSGVSCPLPEPFVKIYDNFKLGNLVEAKKWHNIANEGVKLLKAGSDMSIFKHVLTIRGVKGGEVRKPLTTIDEKEKDYFSDQVSDYVSKF